MLASPYIANSQLASVPGMVRNVVSIIVRREKDFVTTNGALRFNRALYGGNTAFRVEAGDLPEFALYLPGMGGNRKLGILLAVIANGLPKQK